MCFISFFGRVRGGEGWQDLIQIKGPCVPGLFFCIPLGFKCAYSPQQLNVQHVIYLHIRLGSCVADDSLLHQA